MTATVNDLEHQLRKGSARITDEAIDKVCVLLHRHLGDQNSPLRREFIGTVTVNKSGVCVTGSHAALEAAVFGVDKIAAGKVPSFDRKWCRLGDSNT